MMNVPPVDEIISLQKALSEYLQTMGTQKAVTVEEAAQAYLATIIRLKPATQQEYTYKLGSLRLRTIVLL